MPKTIVFYDTEFTSWVGAQESNWGEDWQYRELVQIGAIRFDADTLKELDQFDVLIKPVKNPILSDFLVDLTGITNEHVQDSGVSFSEAYKRFVKFLGDNTCISYGGDHVVVQENCKLYGHKEWANEFSGKDIRPWFGEQGIDTNSINSGALAKSLDLDININEHNALDDVRSICAAFRYLVENGSPNPFIEGNDNLFEGASIWKERN